MSGREREGWREGGREGRRTHTGVLHRLFCNVGERQSRCSTTDTTEFIGHCITLVLTLSHWNLELAKMLEMTTSASAEPLGPAHLPGEKGRGRWGQW